MGNAVSALIDDYAACYYNPAGLALSAENGFTLGYFYAAPRVRTRDALGVERLTFQTLTRAGVVGYRQNLRSLFPEKWGKNIVVALALAFPDNFKTATMVRTRYYHEMQFPVFGRVPDMLVMSAGLGFELHRLLLIGMGMRFSVTYSAKDLTVYLKVLEGQNLFQKVDVNAETEAQPIAGVILRPLDSLRLAAVWRRGGAPVSLVGKGGGKAEIGPIELPLSLNLCFQDFFTPDEFAGALSWAPVERLLLGFELTYARWSKYDDPFGQKPPGDPFFDILIPRFGAEVQVLEGLRAQLGYYWQPSPVRDAQSATRYLDTDEHVFSCACEYALRLDRFLEVPLKLQAYFQVQHLPRRTLTTVGGTMSVWGTITNVGGTVQLSF